MSGPFQHDFGKQAHDALASRFPAIRVGTFGLPVGVDITSFLVEDTICFAQMFFIGRLCQRCRQNTSFRCDHREKTFRATPFQMMFVGCKMLRHLLGHTNRRADEAVAAHAFEQSFPEHIIPAEDLSDNPDRSSNPKQQ